MIVFEREISEHDSLLLSLSDYKKTGYKNICNWILNNSTDANEEWKSKKLDEIVQLAEKSEIENQALIRQMIKKYVPEEYHNEEYIADFDYLRLKVTVSEKSSCCNK